MRRMSMWYDVAGVLILKDSVCPTFTLIDVAKPWIVASPEPLSCQSLGGSPGKVFSQAITLVTGGPHGLAAAAGRTLTRESRLTHNARVRPMASFGRDTRSACLIPDIGPPTGSFLLQPYVEDARPAHCG